MRKKLNEISLEELLQNKLVIESLKYLLLSFNQAEGQGFNSMEYKGKDMERKKRRRNYYEGDFGQG